VILEAKMIDNPNCKETKEKAEKSNGIEMMLLIFGGFFKD
jgi:hypothetical protein